MKRVYMLGIRMFKEIPKEDIISVFVSENAFEKHEDIINDTKIEPYILPDKLYSGISDTATPQGIMAVVKMKERTLDEVLDNGTTPFIIITEKLQDKERYQTVYSNEIGSSAAPTAGLHFTKEMLSDLESKGINIAYVTLHVGLGTFRPVKVEEITDHKMHSEHYFIPKETAEIINKTKQLGGRIICVGTTSCRTLESAATKFGEIKECSDDTDIFIYPGYQFKVMDCLITNFHLPESTLIMLVSAFAGYENTMNAYDIAVKEKYRFFSFGDAMFIE